MSGELRDFEDLEREPPAVGREWVAGDERPARAVGIALLPSAATLCNLLCGVLAILCCLLAVRAVYSPAHAALRHPYLAEFFPTYVAGGAYLLVLALIFDALDGRLARLARRTSEFGAQLDSMADVISFGVAPAALYITTLLRLAHPAEGDPTVSGLLWRFGVVVSLVYASCAAIRLARYNAENVRDESAQRRFCGLPAPGAAAGFIALLILHEDLAYGGLSGWGLEPARVLRWMIGPLVLGLSLLMVSRLDYMHVFNNYVVREHPPTHLVWLVIAAGIAWYSPQVLLVVLAYAYVVSGLVLNLQRWREAWRAASRARNAAPRDLERHA